MCDMSLHVGIDCSSLLSFILIEVSKKENICKLEISKFIYYNIGIFRQNIHYLLPQTKCIDVRLNI